MLRPQWGAWKTSCLYNLLTLNHMRQPAFTRSFFLLLILAFVLCYTRQSAHGAWLKLNIAQLPFILYRSSCPIPSILLLQLSFRLLGHFYLLLVLNLAYIIPSLTEDVNTRNLQPTTWTTQAPTLIYPPISSYIKLQTQLLTTYAIDMRQTINDIVQQHILRGRTELQRLTTVLYSLGTINILTSLFLLGITTVLILSVFHKSFKSIIFKPASAVRSDIGVVVENGTSSNRMKKDRPFGGMWF